MRLKIPSGEVLEHAGVVRGVLMSYELRAYELRHQDEFGPSAKQLWDVMAATIDVRDRMGSLTFKDMREVPALHAVAWGCKAGGHSNSTNALLEAAEEGIAQR